MKSDKKSNRTDRRTEAFLNGRYTLLRSAAIFFAAAAAVCGILAIFSPWHDSPPAWSAFNPVTTVRGSYVYLDVVAISDCLMKDETKDQILFYHSAEDEGGYLYIVRMSDADLKKFAPQYDYWKSGHTGPPPQPYRIYGKAFQMTQTNTQTLAKVWGVSSEQVNNYFGQKCIDINVSPAEDIKAICKMLSSGFLLLCFIAGVPYMIIKLSVSRQIKKQKKN